MAGKPRRYRDEQLARAVAASRNMREVLIALGLAARGGNYETVRRRIALLGLDAAHLDAARTRGVALRLCSDEMIAGVVRDSRSYAQAAAKLGLRGGGNHSRLKGRIERSGIDTSHFVGKAWRKDRHRPNVPATPLEVLLVEGRPTLSNDLKKRLILAGLKKWRCETCGRDRWNGRPIPLELDHVNGKRDDNRLTNLRLLCPNCHAQTPTYRGRNIGVGIAYAE